MPALCFFAFSEKKNTCSGQYHAETENLPESYRTEKETYVAVRLADILNKKPHGSVSDNIQAEEKTIK